MSKSMVAKNKSNLARRVTKAVTDPTVQWETVVAAIKGALGFLPCGTLLNEALFEARSRIKQERVNTFVGELSSAVRVLSEESIKKEFLTSEEFSDLIEDIFHRVTRTRSEQKRGHLRDVLVAAIQGRHDPDFGPLFLGVLEQVTEPELRVLQGFSKFVNDGSMEIGAIDYKDGLWDLQAPVAKQVVQALVAKGLLVDTSFGRYDAVPFTFVEPTELGRAFLGWLDGKAA